MRREVKHILALLALVLCLAIPAYAEELTEMPALPEAEVTQEESTPVEEAEEAEEAEETELPAPEEEAEEEEPEQKPEEPSKPAVPETPAAGDPLIPSDLPEGVEDHYTITYGEQEEWDFLRLAFGYDEEHPENWKLIMSCADDSVVEVDEETGLFTAKKAGAAVITIKDVEKGVFYDVTVTVKRAEVVSTIEDSYTWVYSGKSHSWAQLLSGDGKVSCSASEEGILRLNADGSVTENMAGTLTLTISTPRTDRYEAFSTTTEITIEKAPQQIKGRAAAYTWVYSATAHDFSSTRTTGDGALSFVSSDPTVVSAKNTGMITAKKAGTAVITITAAETDRYEAASFDVSITVTKAEQKLMGRAAAYTWTYSDKTYDFSNIRTTGNGLVRFSSSDSSVVSVGSASGIITMKKAGTAVITVTGLETAKFKACTYPITITINKAPQKVSGLASSYTYGYSAGRTYDLGSLVKVTGVNPATYTSSNANVVSVDKNTGVLTIKGKGTATITVNVAGNGRYTAASAKTTINVKSGQAFRGLETSYTVPYVKDKTYDWGKKLTVLGNAPLTYTSDNPEVVSVDANGVLTLKGVGKAVITIKAAETKDYVSAVFKSTVTVEKGVQKLSGLEAKYNLRDDKIGSSFHWDTRVKNTGDGAITYASDNTAVATVGKSSGVVTIKGKGKAVITVTAAETALYKSAALKVPLYVGQDTPVLGGIEPAYSVPFVSGKTYNWGARLTNTGDGKPTFTSSNTAVATVNASTGVITLKGYGTTTITVTTAETDTYTSGTLTSQLTVYRSPLSYNFSSAYMNSVYYRRLMEVQLCGNQRDDIVAVAMSQVGYHEGSSMSGYGGDTYGSKNYTEYGRWYYNYVDSSDVYYAGAWCAMFTSWCANEAGVSSSTIPRKALVAYMQSSFTSMGRYYTWHNAQPGGGAKAIQKGDLIIYSATATGRYSHIGIVTSVVYSGNRVTINTVEGNADDQCTTRRWSLSTSGSGQVDTGSYIRGFCCPNYK